MRNWYEYLFQYGKIFLGSENKKSHWRILHYFWNSSHIFEIRIVSSESFCRVVLQTIHRLSMDGYIGHMMSSIWGYLNIFVVCVSRNNQEMNGMLHNMSSQHSFQPWRNIHISLLRLLNPSIFLDEKELSRTYLISVSISEKNEVLLSTKLCWLLVRGGFKKKNLSPCKIYR